MSELSDAANRVIDKHKSLRKAAKALRIDPGYLSRLRSGLKTNPSDELLKKLGLAREIRFRGIK